LLEYRASWLPNDVGAGLSVAAIALPVGIAYAELAGVPAVFGMYSAIFPLFIYALFGSSRQLMTGPDAATCIIVAATLGPLAAGDPDKYMALLVVLTLMTGLIYILGGVARLGFIANFLSMPILTGYLNGIALLILAGQLKTLFGYSGDASEFIPKLIEFAERVDQIHLPTLMLGTSVLLGLVVLRRVAPGIPGAFVVVAASIAAVPTLGLEERGIALLGNVPAGIPAVHLPGFDLDLFEHILGSAAGIVLVSFTSGILTAKSFAQRNGYDINANQEMIAFGACNLGTGLLQGFPVTGADSRTAVNSAMSGKTQLVGIVAGGTMLLVLLFLTGPLAWIPNVTLAAVIIVSAAGLFDWSHLRSLFRMSYRELLLSVTTTLGVLVLGVLPGVLLAVALSLAWLLTVGSRPHDAILGRVPGMKGFHDIADYPQATTIPGLILYRFDANIVFFNADYLRDRVRSIIARAETPVEWVVVDASAINVLDATGLMKLDALRAELAEQGISLFYARVKRTLEDYFNQGWALERRKLAKGYRFQTLKPAVNAYLKHAKQRNEPKRDKPARKPSRPESTVARSGAE